MRNFYKGVVSLILFSFCTFGMSACTKTPNPVLFKDVIIENLRQPYEGPNKKIQTNIIYDVSAARSILESFGFSSDTISFFDDNYFMSNDLVVIIIHTSISYEYSVEKLEQSGEKLNVILNEKIPPNVEDMLTYKGILINVAKKATVKTKTITVDVNSIKE